MILGLALAATPVYATDPLTREIMRMLLSYNYEWSPVYQGYAGDGRATIIVEGEAPCTYEAALDYYRDDPSYINEDDDYIYLKAKVDPLNAKHFINDPDGQKVIALLKQNIYGWVEAGCPEGQ